LATSGTGDVRICSCQSARTTGVSIDDRSGDEPDLYFVDLNRIADEHIVGALVVALCSDICGLSCGSVVAVNGFRI
jgi:hypothetical protein